VRLLIATQFLGIVGGAEKYLQALIPELAARGHELCLVHEYPGSQGEQTIDRDDLCFKCSFSELGLELLLKKSREWNPDLIFCHGLSSPALESALLSTFPIAVMYVHGYYGTCGTGAKVHTFPIVEPCKRQFGKMCLVLHYPRRCGGLNPITTWRNFQVQSHRQELFQSYRSLMAASRHMVQEFAAHGVLPDKLHLVPYPNTDILPQADPPSFRPPTGKLLYLGRLSKEKGIDHLLNAIPKAQKNLGYNLCLTIAGSGPAEQSVHALAERSKLQIKFVGWADRETRLKLLQEADLLAVPSVWPEPFGLVGVEAACLALPAVAFNVGGISDWLEAGVTGELASGDPPRSAELASAITRALQDPNHHHRLREGAWRKSHEFTISRHIAQLEAIFSAALSESTVRVQTTA
jgi:glycosyltransferase involved in cell wall biosynthesis